MEPDASTARVRDAVRRAGFEVEIREFPEGTRTAADAAHAVGCSVAQIAKSLVFKGERSGRALLVITSGANRVDEAKLAALAGEPVAKADPDFVRAATGFVIGGVPPVGHSQPVDTWIDQDLLGWDEVWAAAGTPRAVFRLAGADLEALTGGKAAEVKLVPGLAPGEG